jgi:hypothetical protein
LRVWREKERRVLKGRRGREKVRDQKTSVGYVIA